MKLLLDTHTFIFAFDKPESLSERVRNLLSDRKVERWVSTVCFWEIATKVRIGKLDLPLDRQFHTDRLRELQAKPLPVEFTHSMALFQLPLHHKDPFDRMLIAQAREEGLTLASRDEHFAAYDVPTIW